MAFPEGTIWQIIMIDKLLIVSQLLKNKDQLDVTCYFILLLMCSTCFGH